MLRFPLAVAIFYGISCVAYAADPYAGGSILPKVELLTVRSEGTYTAVESDFGWPATIVKTEGQWLLITDDGQNRIDGRPSAGWVRKVDVILTSKDPIETRFSNATEYFTHQLSLPPYSTKQLSDVRSFWLRGLCWEGASDLNAARDDYYCATRCPDIQGKCFEDRVHAGLGRCLAQLAIRDNSAIFGTRKGIETLKELSGLPYISSPKIDVMATFGSSKFDASRFDWEAAANKAKADVIRFGEAFQAALSKCPRPRTFADWADSLLVPDLQDIPYFGYFVVPSFCHLNPSPWPQLTQINYKDLLRCDCVGGNTIDVLPIGSEITIPSLCNQALANCRHFDVPYLIRSRYYQSKAQGELDAHIQEVAAWRSCRDCRWRSVADVQSSITQARSSLESNLTDVAQLPGLAEDFLTRGKQPENGKLKNWIDLQVDRSIEAVDAANIKPTRSPQMIGEDIQFYVRWLVLSEQQQRIKDQLARLQLEAHDFRCESLPGTWDNETGRFYYNWRLAIRDATEATMCSKAKSSNAIDASRRRAILLLMRISPITLQPTESAQYAEIATLLDSLSDIQKKNGLLHATPAQEPTVADIAANASVASELKKFIDGPAWSNLETDTGAARGAQLQADVSTLLASENYLNGLRSRSLQRAKATAVVSNESLVDVQDMQLAAQALVPAEQAAKLGRYKGEKSLTVWAAALAASGQYDDALRRLATGGPKLASPAQQYRAASLYQSICRAKASDQPIQFKCASAGTGQDVFKCPTCFP